MYKYFAVSDIHSYYDELIAALTNAKFNFNNPQHKLIICGDAFDRGDQTIELFNFMKQLQSENRLIYILGNHEDLLFDCIKELSTYGRAGNHHYHNQTIKTLSHFIDEDDFWMYSTYIPTSVIDKIVANTKELRDFISKNGVNYFELGNRIFTHSWLPIYNDLYKGDIIWPEWNKEPIQEEILTFNKMWKDARWGNPYLQWKNKLYPEGKTIVFGHFHTSYGHSHIDMKTKEWPQKNRKDWLDAFSPWIKENAIGLDACCAYSGKINCVVFDKNGKMINYI